MLRYALLGALSLACLSTAAIAAPKEKAACAPIAMAEKAAAEVAKRSGSRLIHLSGSDAQKVVTTWNALPPVSDQVAQDVLLVISPEAPGAFLAFVDKGRVCGFKPMPTMAMMVLLRRAFSVPAKTVNKEDDTI